MENTSRNFVLQLGALATLYAVITAGIVTIFGIISIFFPDVAQGRYEQESAQSMMRFGIATLLVFFPTYIILTRFVNQVRRKEEGVYLTLTRWLIYLSLFVGGAVLLGDVVATILAFLNGELTIRFALKALTLFTIIGLALSYYIYDAKGYWDKHEFASKLYGVIASVIVLVIISTGFFLVDSPKKVREARIDAQQISDLQNIQWRIEEYYNVENLLPGSLDVVYERSDVPTAPEGRPPYMYNVRSSDQYELCAYFMTESTNYDYSYARPLYGEGNYSWDYKAGETCFTRTVSKLDKAL